MGFLIVEWDALSISTPSDRRVLVEDRGKRMEGRVELSCQEASVLHPPCLATVTRAHVPTCPPIDAATATLTPVAGFGKQWQGGIIPSEIPVGGPAGEGGENLSAGRPKDWVGQACRWQFSMWGGGGKPQKSPLVIRVPLVIFGPHSKIFPMGGAWPLYHSWATLYLLRSHAIAFLAKTKPGTHFKPPPEGSIWHSTLLFWSPFGLEPEPFGERCPAAKKKRNRTRVMGNETTGGPSNKDDASDKRGRKDGPPPPSESTLKTLQPTQRAGGQSNLQRREESEL